MLLVLGILKWILLIILILFLLLLILLLLLLFVPFRYEIFGEKEREEKLPRGRGKLSYPGLKISGSFQEGNLEYKGKFRLIQIVIVAVRLLRNRKFRELLFKGGNDGKS